MNSNEQAREHLAHDRSQAEQRQSAMAARTQTEMEQSVSMTEEQSREELSEQRLHQEQREETMAKRTEAEIH